MLNEKNVSLLAVFKIIKVKILKYNIKNNKTNYSFLRMAICYNEINIYKTSYFQSKLCLFCVCEINIAMKTYVNIAQIFDISEKING